MSKKHWIQIKVGLSRDAKHRERLGVKIWLYMHMIDRCDWSSGIITQWIDKEEAEDMNMRWRTLQGQRQELESDGYITCIQHKRYQEIIIHNWHNPRAYGEGAMNVRGKGTQKSVPKKNKGTPKGTPKGSRKPSTRTPNSGSQVSGKDSTVKKRRAPCKRDLVFEALTEASGNDIKNLTKQARGMLNRYAKELKEVNATPEQIVRFPMWYKQHIIDQEPSVAGFSKYWPRYLKSVQPPELADISSSDVELVPVKFLPSKQERAHEVWEQPPDRQSRRNGTRPMADAVADLVEHAKRQGGET